MVGLKTPFGRNSHFISFTEEFLFFLPAGDMDSANSPNKTRWVFDWFLCYSESFAPFCYSSFSLSSPPPSSLPPPGGWEERLAGRRLSGGAAWDVGGVGGRRPAGSGGGECSVFYFLQCKTGTILFYFSLFCDNLKRFWFLSFNRQFYY